MVECIYLIGAKTVFLTLYSNSRQYEIKIDNADKDKTAFSSNHGLLRFLVMPFGHFKALDTFQCTIDDVLFRAEKQLASFNSWIQLRTAERGKTYLFYMKSPFI